jgi:hypothetical protein
MRFEILLVAFAAAAVPQENRGRVTRSYSLAALRPSPAPVSAPRYGGFLPDSERDPVTPAPFLAARDGSASGLAAGDILEVLRAALGTGDASLEVQSDALIANCSEDQQKIVAAVLRDLASAFARPIAVEASAHWLSFDGNAKRGGVLGAEEMAAFDAALREAGKPLWSATLDAAPSLVTSGALESLVPYIANYHCEVTKKAKMAEPKIETIRGGLEIALQANPTIGGGGVHISALASFIELRGLTRFKTRAENVGSVDIPQVAGVRVAGTGLVPAGGALALSAGGSDTGTLWLVLRPRPAAAARRLGADAGAKPVLLFPPPFPLSSAGRQLPPLDGELASIPAPSSVVGNPIDLLRGEPQTTRLQLTASGYVLAAGEPAALDALLQRARALEDGESANLGIEVRIVNANDPKGALAAGAPALEFASLAATPGRSAGCILGVEESAVVGYSTHVAEESAIANPEVKNVFRGIVARTRLLETTKNGGVLEFDFMRCDFGPRERVISDATDVGDIDRVPRRVSTLRRVIEVPAGAPLVLGDLGMFGNDRLFAIVSVTVGNGRR